MPASVEMNNIWTFFLFYSSLINKTDVMKLMVPTLLLTSSPVCTLSHFYTTVRSLACFFFLSARVRMKRFLQTLTFSTEGALFYFTLSDAVRRIPMPPLHGGLKYTTAHVQTDTLQPERRQAVRFGILHSE